jgi:hypothetical protein
MAFVIGRDELPRSEHVGLVFPEEGDVVGVEEPGESEEDDDAGEGPEEDADGECAGNGDVGICV